MKAVSRFSLMLVGAVALFNGSQSLAAGWADTSFYLGIQGGVNYGAATAPSQLGSSKRTGVMGGANLEVNVSRSLSIQPEILYVQTESGLTDKSGAILHSSYDSIELPLLVKLQFEGPIAPYLFAGPNFIWNVSKNVNVNSGGDAGSVAFKPASTSWAVDAGAGLHIGAIFASLRYSFMLSGVDNATVNWQSRGIQALAGLQFPL